MFFSCIYSFTWPFKSSPLYVKNASKRLKFLTFDGGISAAVKFFGDTGPIKSRQGRVNLIPASEPHRHLCI